MEKHNKSHTVTYDDVVDAWLHLLMDVMPHNDTLLYPYRAALCNILPPDMVDDALDEAIDILNDSKI